MSNGLYDPEAMLYGKKELEPIAENFFKSVKNLSEDKKKTIRDMLHMVYKLWNCANTRDDDEVNQDIIFEEAISYIVSRTFTRRLEMFKCSGDREDRYLVGFVEALYEGMPQKERLMDDFIKQEFEVPPSEDTDDYDDYPTDEDEDE